jgi:hypothetical protein
LWQSQKVIRMESKVAPDAPDPNPNLIHTQVLDPEGCIIYQGQI